MADEPVRKTAAEILKSALESPEQQARIHDLTLWEEASGKKNWMVGGTDADLSPEQRIHNLFVDEAYSQKSAAFRRNQVKNQLKPSS